MIKISGWPKRLLVFGTILTEKSNDLFGQLILMDTIIAFRVKDSFPLDLPDEASNYLQPDLTISFSPPPHVEI